MAGPLKPPKPAPILGRRVRASIASETKVLTSEIAWAPDSSAAFATGSMLRDVGRELHNYGASAADQRQYL